MADKGHTLYMKVALALHVGRVVQLYTMHASKYVSLFMLGV